MQTIEQRAQAYAEARESLADEVLALEDQINHAKRARLHKIKAALKETAAAHSDLQAALQAAPALFTAPRTRIFHGIKVGYAKGKGKLVWIDVKKVIERIHERMPERADALVNVTEKPVKQALEQLDTKDLKRLGISVENTGDQLVIKPVDSDIDKLIDALFKADDLADEEAAA